MSDAKVRGIVHVRENTKEYGDKGFRKRLVVLENGNGQYSQYIPIEFLRENCDFVDQMDVGDEVEVRYRLSGRKWQKDEYSDVRYFLSAEALGFTVLNKRQYSEAEEEEPPF